MKNKANNTTPLRTTIGIPSWVSRQAPGIHTRRYRPSKHANQQKGKKP